MLIKPVLELKGLKNIVLLRFVVFAQINITYIGLVSFIVTFKVIPAVVGSKAVLFTCTPPE